MPTGAGWGRSGVGRSPGAAYPRELPAAHAPAAAGDLPLRVGGHELRLRVITRESQRGLSEIIGPEGEEVGVLRDPIGDEARAGQLDHRSDGVVASDLQALLLADADDELAHQL